MSVLAKSMLFTLDYTPKPMRATEKIIDAVYAGARMGLKSDESIAYNAGMTPGQYRLLRQMDERVEHAERAGKADGEMEMAGTLFKAAQGGDAKSALEMLKHAHGWVATTAVKHEGDMSITLVTGVPKAPEQLKDPNDLGEY